MLRIDLKAVLLMENVNYDNEKMYLMTMNIMKSLFNKGLVSKEEYTEIDTMFQEKYAPTLGSLFTEIA